MPSRDRGAGELAPVFHGREWMAQASMKQRPPSGQVLALCREGGALLERGRYEDAIRLLRKAVSLDPAVADAWYNLGYALKAAGQFEQALKAYRRALDAGVADPQEVHLNRAAILSNHLHRVDQAEAELRTALALRPDYLPALLNLGNLHEERGQRAEAVDCYEKILAAGGGGGMDYRHEALARLAHLTPPEDPGAPLIGVLRKAAAAAGNPEIRANLWFALGRAYERLGCTDQAFDAFGKANASGLQGAPAYDRARQERFTEALIGQFAMPEPAPAPAGEAPEPLFICGMFRSGSTLLEQALAAHPAIHAGGELELLPRLVAGPLSPFPASMARLTAGRCAELARDYRERIGRLFPEAAGAAFLTDKRPDNFLLIGLIKRLFPGARILHSVRNPLDNGLSVFMQHLNPLATPYAGSLADIGHYYAQYRRVMAHWKQLYPDDIHDVDYDALVRAPQEVLESALAFLGLDWDPACLEFHRLGNTVKTASYWQVRQPLYRDASGRWKRYEKHLGPLRDALARAGIRTG